MDVQFAANGQRQKNKIVQQPNAQEKPQARVSLPSMIRKVRCRHQHDYHTPDDGADIGHPGQNGGGQTQQNGVGNPHHRQSERQANGVQEGKQKQALKIILETAVQTGKKQQRLFEVGVRHAADNVFFEPRRIVQHKIGDVRNEQQGRQALQELQGDGQKIILRESIGKLVEVNIHFLAQFHPLENRRMFFQRLRRPFDQIFSAIHVAVKTALPAAGPGQDKQAQNNNAGHDEQLEEADNFRRRPMAHPATDQPRHHRPHAIIEHQRQQDRQNEPDYFLE